MSQSILALRFYLLLLLSLTFGLFNLVCFVTVLTTKNLRGGAGILLGHMMLVEATMCLLFFPISQVFVYVHLRSVPTCRIFMFFFALVNNVGFYNILILAVNRFIAINLPLHYHKLSTAKCNAAFVLTSWVVCITLNLPMEFNGGVGHYGVNPVYGGCITEVVRPELFDYKTLHSYLAIYFPLAMTGLLYGCVLLKQLSKCKRITPASQMTTREAGIIKRKLRIFWMLLVSYVLYAFCFLTYPVLTRALPDTVSKYPMLPLWILLIVVCGYFVHPVRVLQSLDSSLRCCCTTLCLY
ncbi:hypothetical protein RvY_12614-2 [Ramazzottius varieornatus]|nr:hypothetical protein RvY_12614-2 [Ramazzottius varieornatus]